jgi:hypothetical protein
VACLNPGLDDLQERTVATGTRAVAGYELRLGLHPGVHWQTRAYKKALFHGAFSKPFYGGGDGGTLPARVNPDASGALRSPKRHTYAFWRRRVALYDENVEGAVLRAGKFKKPLICCESAGAGEALRLKFSIRFFLTIPAAYGTRQISC